ncbi:DUF6907 domain-containing protein [Streptomyces sp. NRRL F-5630]|uniref:DUF6907 domain-containing protein n=1 Tax=Streptomyces sp. NRRL F-5630 TaxID=1463864 RepID=UPI003D713947
MGNLPTFVNAAVEQPEAASAEAAARTITYPLVGGGFLSVACPSWCTETHEHDLLHGVEPADVVHEGDDVSTSFELACNNGTQTLLQARIVQAPYSETLEERRPHVVFRPEPENETVADQYMTTAGLDRVIKQLQTYTIELMKLSKQLGEARAEEHAGRRAWLDAQDRPVPPSPLSLNVADAQSMPLAYLMKQFNARVIEENVGEGEGLAETRMVRVGDEFQVRLDYRLTQIMREDAIRRLFVQYLGGAR